MRMLLHGTLLGLLVLVGCTQVRVYPPEAEQAASNATASASAASAAEASADTPKDPFKPWDKTLEETTKIDGFIPVHQKRDNTVYLELAPERLGQDFGMVMHFSRGVGDFNLHDGLPLSDMQLMRFVRVGDELHLIHRNPRFTADAGSPMQASLNDNVGHSIAHVFKIESQHTDTENLLVDATSFFASDYADMGERMRYYFRNTPPRFEKEKSYVERIMGFPENVEIDAALSYGTNGRPMVSPEAVSDVRSIPVGVRYSLVKLPETPMQPRYADDRIGHFITAVRDFSRDRADTPYLRYVERWRLEPKDPDAVTRGELSEPVEPIVYYIDRSVPQAYRPYVKEGIEAWNKAYEAAGFKNAIVAKEAPDDSTWSAEDARYSTVRWTAAHRMGYAIGPSQTDPRSGEILNADVLISSTFVTGWRNTYQRLAADPTALYRETQEAQRLYETSPEQLRDRMCLAETGKSHQLALQHLYMLGLGTLRTPQEMPEDYLGDAIRDLTMHEVGHTLGMRHNFKGSSAIPFDRLHDEDFTRENGVSLSVMEYAPVNVAVDPEEQGHYWNVEVGAYDVWNIQYAYQPIFVEPTTMDEPLDDGEVPASRLVLAPSAEAEMEGLARIAEQAADPLHAYATDGDNWIGPYAVDPMVNAWDLGSDPLAWARKQAELADRVQPTVEARLIADGEGYQQLRGATASLLYQRMSSLMPAARYVGGLHAARDHKGDPNARMPFRPVEASQQRAAVAHIVDQAFAPKAIVVDAALVNKLAPNYYSHWGMGYSPQLDFPMHEVIGSGQGMLLDELLNPIRLGRMIDNEVRMLDGAEPYAMSEMLHTLSTAIWAELEDGRPADSFRRNLQRMYTNRLVGLSLGEIYWQNPDRPARGPEVPEHARSLARLELTELAGRVDAALASGTLDRDMQAHLLETQARVRKALDAPIVMPAR